VNSSGVEMDAIKIIAFIGFGIAVSQIWVHFALQEFWKEHDDGE